MCMYVYVFLVFMYIYVCINILTQYIHICVHTYTQTHAYFLTYTSNWFSRIENNDQSLH